MKVGAASTSALSKNGDLRLVPTKTMNVFLDPLQRGHLVFKPVVSRSLIVKS